MTSIYFGCHGGIVRKPYNPILGEVFRCTWETKNLKRADGSPIFFRFVAEQVRHHPPISAFHLSAEGAPAPLEISGEICAKSKYLGMSVGAVLGGEIFLRVQSEIYRKISNKFRIQINFELKKKTKNKIRNSKKKQKKNSKFKKKTKQNSADFI